MWRTDLSIVLLLFREKNAYVILRELHKIEKNREVLLACENLVDILIKKEEEISIEKYTDVEVPDDVVEKLNEIDKEYLNSINLNIEVKLVQSKKEKKIEKNVTIYKPGLSGFVNNIENSFRQMKYI